MTKQNKTLIAVVLDRSGSMSSILMDTIGGFNTFLNEQKALGGECLFSLYQFDNHYATVVENVDITTVDELTTQTFVPRGGTALFDAIGRTINSVGAQLAALAEDERPDRVMVMIMTDGDENQSREFSRDSIREMIIRQTEKYNWQFLFVGANQDAVLTAQGLGISKDTSLTYGTSKADIGSTYDLLSQKVSMYRSCSVAPTAAEMSFTAAERGSTFTN